MSATWANPSVRREMQVGSRGEGRERILTLHAIVGQVPGALPTEHDRAVLGRAHEQPADVRVLAERGQEEWVALLDLLLREPALFLHQVDEPEISGAHDDDLPIRDVVLRPLRRLPGRLRQRVADHRVLLVSAGDLGHVSACERALDEIVQAVPVSLLEGRALCLAMVGEDDDLVRPRCVAASPVDARELLVELPQRLERVGPFEPGVMGDLVVAREGRVDRRPTLHEVRQDAEDDQVADDDAHRAAQERIDAAPMTAWLHVAADRAQGGDPLEDDLPEEEDERTE